MSRQLSMKTKVIVFVAMSLITLVGLALTSFVTFNSVKVGGDAYNEVLESERLIADVLPPPAFIVESFLTVQELADNTDPNMDSILRWRLADLRADFNERHDFYVDSVTDPDLTETLKGDSQESARQFFDLVDTEFLPALDAGDRDTAQSLASNELRELYEEHRTSIERVVVLAAEDSRQAESSAEQLVTSRSTQLLIAVVVTFIMTALTGAAVALSIIRPVRRVVHTATVTLPAMVERIRDDADATVSVDELETTSNDELGQATRAFNSVIQETIDMARTQANLRRTAQENFVNLGRRNQNLLSRQLQLIEKAEEGEADPEVLDTLFKIDHLAARMRRNAESLLVLAERQPLRKRRGPVALDDVLRAASSEIEQYQRVKVGEGNAVDIDGQYAPELVHLFAEILENAVRYSSPDTDVTVTTSATSDGCSVAIIDKGIGLSADELQEANRRLSAEARVSDATKLGHYVVGRLATRLGVSVRLEARDGGGLTAVIVMPNELLSRSDGGSDRSDRLALGLKLDRVANPKVVPVEAAPVEAAPVEPVPVEVTVDEVDEVDEDDLVDAPAVLAYTDSENDIPAPSTLAASFGLRKRQSGSSLAKTQRLGNRSSDGPARNAESVRDRFSSFAAGRQQAADAGVGAETTTEEETN